MAVKNAGPRRIFIAYSVELLSNELSLCQLLAKVNAARMLRVMSRRCSPSKQDSKRRKLQSVIEQGRISGVNLILVLPFIGSTRIA